MKVLERKLSPAAKTFRNPPSDCNVPSASHAPVSVRANPAVVFHHRSL